MTYEPTLASLRRHAVPEWFHNAKLGIFVHWGLYSVPAWAPTSGPPNEVIAQEGWAGWFARNPYAEWYLNSIKIAGSPSHEYHVSTYGAGFPYDGFAPLFSAATSRWDPGSWTALFRRAGARYVVLTTKHHDGYLLWPSAVENPRQGRYCSERDLVGDLTQAVRAQGLRMGLYYSGGLDWTFNGDPICDVASLLAGTPQSADYVRYADAHWRELIERYQPAVLWNDIAYPTAANLRALFAHYYNRLPDGVVNDRFVQSAIASSRLGRFLLRILLPLLARATGGSSMPAGPHWDFRTPEYTSYSRITPYKWEATRGLGFSFGYNRNEGPEQMLSAPELVRSFVDIVSKNGNLLLNVGPMADGTIPDLQQERLLGLGQWLQTNGEAIYDTRPWTAAEGATAEGVAVRFTQRPGALYAILLAAPQGRVSLRGLRAAESSAVHVLGREGALAWRQEGEQLTIALPPDLPGSPAHALRITPQPQWIE